MQLGIANKVLGVATLSIVGLTGVVNSAEAASLTGILNITGAIKTQSSAAAPLNDKISFLDSEVKAATTNGDFDVYDGALATVADVLLTKISGNDYSGTTTNPFISISPDLTFIADNPFQVEREFNLGVVDYDFEVFTGKFVNALGETLGKGVLTANSIKKDGSFSMTLTAAEAVPEPTTTLGLLAVGGLFAAAKRNKKQAV